MMFSENAAHVTAQLPLSGATISGLALLVAGLWAELELHAYLVSAGSGYETRIVLLGIAYGGFLACIFMMDAGVGASVACYKDTFSKGLHDGLTQSLANYKYPERANFDFTQSTLHCCGVNNYTDWLSRQKLIPLSCCVESNQCVPANYNQIYNRGCYDVIVEHVNSNMNLIIGVAIGMAIFPLFGTILSCCLANYIKKSKYDAIN
ncbi:Tetraspanin-7 [Eumeta japonica]|uniref:Tetraspanin n=1 Tax=Eumeta variegata TaxID=151549 RepID=A0A4C1ZIT6_EUMVA|nr:Tetraspanin-7 [Eumeta japonica]